MAFFILPNAVIKFSLPRSTSSGLLDSAIIQTHVRINDSGGFLFKIVFQKEIKTGVTKVVFAVLTLNLIQKLLRALPACYVRFIG